MPIKLTCHCDICGKEMTGLGSKYQENKLSEDNQPDLSLIGTKYNVICIHCRQAIRETIKNLTYTNKTDVENNTALINKCKEIYCRNPNDHDLRSPLRRAFDSFGKIGAIKELRALTNLDLNECKKMVEHWINEFNWDKN